jgi:hypothetical protein
MIRFTHQGPGAWRAILVCDSCGADTQSQIDNAPAGTPITLTCASCGTDEDTSTPRED